ncbi:putative bifunctional diguanylate cyclase/phosphodiesterase [Brevibacillus sp. SYSU BS000544]|uniref:putative bifunctional diguanylate cyclase/phosphodiesterase n=1 Tax=Brevibacillus sp. SYSU BS000544 TaxID=3416443 RepID=UPI003CE529F0
MNKDQSLLKSSFFPFMNTDQSASFMVDQNAEFTGWSHKFSTLLGIDLVGVNLYDLVAPNHKEALQKILHRVVNGEQQNIEIQLIDEKGIHIPFSLAFVPLYHKERIIGINGFAEVKDIHSLFYFGNDTVNRLIADHSTDLIAIVNLDGQIHYASPSHRTILGYVPNDYKGTDSLEYIHPEDREKVIEFTKLVIQQRKESITEFRFQHSAGYWTVIESKAFPILQEGGHVHAIVWIGREITERKLDEQKINYLAYYDPLTDLPNRMAFRERLEQEITKSGNDGFAVLFLDMDRFKLVNDALGHPKGELLLKDVGKRISESLKERDLVARISSDEFTIILSDTSVEEAKTVADTIVELFHLPFYLEGHEFFITASIGISIYPTDGTTVDDIVRNSNTAMYHAKTNGGNGYQFYAPAMNIPSIERLTLENQLRKALEREELEVYYQPQVDLATGRMMGLEALIRWNHPERGMISPAVFIPLAEETGLILSLGDWVLRTACSQLKAWHDADMPRMPVSVNLSPRQFLKKDLAESIHRALDESGLDPQWLELEITESVLMQNSETNIAMLRRIREMGIRISIDDFGTGYSSLGYLKRFPIDSLKIDQSFIRDMITNREDAAIATAIISLAHNLNLKVIAEGIETEEQALFLRSQRCNAMQGYLFSPPIPVKECTSILEQEKVLLAIQKED